jgi:hypothetical protein
MPRTSLLVAYEVKFRLVALISWNLSRWGANRPIFLNPIIRDSESPGEVLLAVTVFQNPLFPDPNPPCGVDEQHSNFSPPQLLRSPLAQFVQLTGHRLCRAW